MHLAARVQSVNEKGKNFTAPGLGDRIHLLTAAYCYSREEKSEVTLHLSSDKKEGHKLNSFLELRSLLPENSIKIEFHDFIGGVDSEWINYLDSKGINAKLFSYNDHLGRFETKTDIDISKYLKRIPLLATPLVKNEQPLPSKFITTQWDSTAKSRTLNQVEKNKVLEKYKRRGYEIVTIGGESQDPLLKTDVLNAAFAIAKSDYFVGVDSGFMHLAFLYKPFHKIHLYNEPKGYWSHHLLRAIDNGCKLNLYYKKISLFDCLRIKIVYDNAKVYRAVNKYHRISKFLYSSNILKQIFKAKIGK